MSYKQWILFFFFILSGFLSYGQYAVFRDSTGKSSIGDVIKKTQYFAKRKNLDFGLDNVWFWIKIPLTNPFNKPITKYIVLENSYLDLAHAYQTDGQKVNVDFGPKNYETAFKSRFLQHHSFIFPIEIPPKVLTYFYMKVHRHQLLVTIPLKIFSIEEFYEYDTRKRLIYGIFSGVILTLIVFSFVLFVVNRQIHFIYYGAYLCFLLFSILLVEGYLVDYVQKINAPFSIYHWRNVAICFSTFFLGLFIRSFILKGAENNRFIQKIFLVSIVSIAISLLLFALEKPFRLNYWPQPLLLIFLPFVLLILSLFIHVFMVIYSFKKGIQPFIAKMFFVGFLPFFLYSTFSLFRNGGMLDHSPWLSYLMRLGCILFDSIILFIGIALQIKLLGEEKDKNVALAFQNQLKLLQEKERISRDLHDSVGSQLTVISTSLDNASYQAEKHILKPEKINQIRESVGDAVQSLRDSIWATHQSEINLENFSQRLKTYCSKLSNTDLAISIHLSENNITINALTALCLFRILQECIQNTLKHAHATQITITGNFENKTGSLSIADNGVGFEIDELVLKENFGMENMKKRIEEIDGSLQIVSHKKQGTTVFLHFPV
jgi:signal transduction histidine kinase